MARKKERPAGKFVKHIACEDCGSNDNLAVYEREDGIYDGFCWGSCDSYKKIDQNLEQYDNVKKEINTVSNKLSVKEITETFETRGVKERKIKKDVCEKYGMKVGYLDDGKTIGYHYYPFTKNAKIVGYQEREVETKEFVAIGYGKSDIELIGQNLFKPDPEKDITLTEGFLDCAAFYQTINAKYKSEYPVVSLPAGANDKCVRHNIEWLNGWRHVIIMTDQDPDGQKVAEDIAKILEPGKAKIAKMSEKDPCDMLIEGKEEELLKAYWDAKPFKINEVVSAKDVIDEACKMPEWGISWPWPTLTKLTYGIRRKEAYYVGAGVGIGKTNWAKQVQSHLINEHGLPIGVFMLEETVGKTLKGIAGKIKGKAFHRPDAGFTEKELRDAIEEIDPYVWLYNHYGVRDWEHIKSAIRYMVVALGVKDIFLDNLTALVSHLSSGEANDEINTISGELASMLNELDFTLYGFSHLNSPKMGPPHERGGMVNEYQYTGSRGLMRYGHYLFGIERNKHPELCEKERNRSNFVLLKDREFGNVGNFCIEYQPNTDAYLEPDDAEDWSIIRGDPDDEQKEISRKPGAEFSSDEAPKKQSFEVLDSDEEAY